MKHIGKLYSVILGLILIIIGVRLLWFLIEANKTMVVPAHIGFAGYLSILLLSMAGCYMIFSVIETESRKAVIDTKTEYRQWLTKRITELQQEYDSIIAYDTENEFKVKIIKGGKLKGYKETLDYIITH